MRARLSALLAGALVLTAGCAPQSTELVVSGTVEDTLVTVVAPSLSAPAVNLDAGFPDLTGPTNPSTGRTSPSISTLGGRLGLGSTVRIGSVRVREGDVVHSGQALAGIDTATQKVAVTAARADAAVARAQVGLLDEAIADTFDAEADIEDAKDKVHDAIDRIHTARKQLRTALAGARSARADLVAKLQAMRYLLAHYPPVVPPGSDIPPKQELPGIIRGLQAGIRKVDAGIRKIHSLQRKLAKGLAKARSGLRKLEDASAKVVDARGSLRDVRQLAVLQAEAMKIPVDVARLQLTLATLTAPVDGVVVEVAAAGDRVAAGAPVVRLRENGPSTVTAWLSPGQLATVCAGDTARITGDWLPGSGVQARLTRIGTAADYPPTAVATDEIHLTRAVEVEFTATEQLPAGVPVEISIQPCRPMADNDPNR